MERWDEKSSKVNKIRKDPEKAKALLKMTALRERRTQSTLSKEFTTLLGAEYEERRKELITGWRRRDGGKTVSHELLVGYIAEFYPECSDADIALIDQLRSIRNDIAYRGIMIDHEYLERNQESILVIIDKLKKVLIKRLRT